MRVEQTGLPGVLLITPRRFGDDRGFFEETWNKAAFRAAGVNLPEFVQDNHSMSTRTGTLRGLHYQSPPMAQGKLVRCGRGRLLDVAVDARRGSPSYGKWVTAELSFDNGAQLWIPAGYLHGFVTLEPDTEIVYKCTNFYSGAHDGSVAWDSVGIDWSGVSDPQLSDKDKAATPFADWESPFDYEGDA